MVRNVIALLGLYWAMGLLTASPGFIGSSSGVDITRLWIIVLTITVCSVAPLITRYVLNWYENKAYEQWLETP